MSDVHFKQPKTIPPNFLPEQTYYASDTRINSIIYGCMLAVIMNPVRQLHRPGKFGHLPMGSIGSLRFGHDIRVNRYGMRSDDFDTATVDRGVSFSVLGLISLANTDLQRSLRVTRHVGKQKTFVLVMKLTPIED